MLQVLKTTPSVKGAVSRAELKKKKLQRQMMVCPLDLQVQRVVVVVLDVARRGLGEFPFRICNHGSVSQVGLTSDIT